MRLDLKALAFALALLGGGMMFVIGIANLIWPEYGDNVLGLAASIYPGYEGIASFGQVILGTVYALVDWFIGGLILAWLYNAFVSAPTESST
jgi:hypothetical protein